MTITGPVYVNGTAKLWRQDRSWNKIGFFWLVRNLINVVTDGGLGENSSTAPHVVQLRVIGDPWQVSD